MHAVVHYGEIGTKSGNRRTFEDRLAQNVARALAPIAEVNVRREPGRLVFSLEAVPEARRDEALRLAALQPGVAWIAAAVRTEPTMEALCATAVELARRGTGSFRIRARRSEKTLPWDSLEIQRTVGAAVQQATGRAVDLVGADATYAIEIDRRAAYVHDARIEGPDGLPCGSAGRVVALLSGGIDSPVAAWRMMVRGCEVVALHLWNRSFSGEGVREKVLDLGRALARHQGKLRLVLVPFDEIQRAVVAASPADLRMLLYRRAMLRVAGRVRQAAHAQGIVVGDSVSQVASQTLSNLATVYDGVPPPILAPLHGALKRDTIATAQRIGTYEISVRPGDDCCGLLVARHPRTQSSVEEVREIEAGYDLEALVTAAAELRETHDFQAVEG
jgi:tRNA uracil 4-sulfurtransferase